MPKIKKIAVKVAINRQSPDFSSKHDEQLALIPQGGHGPLLANLASKWNIDENKVYKRWWYLVIAKNRRKGKKQKVAAVTSNAGLVLYVVDNSRAISRISKVLFSQVPLLSVIRKNNIPVETSMVPAIKDIVSNRWPEMSFRFSVIPDNKSYSRMTRSR